MLRYPPKKKTDRETTCIACRYGLVRVENCSLCGYLANKGRHSEVLVEFVTGEIVEGHIQSDVPAKIFHGKPLKDDDAISIVVGKKYKIPDEPPGIANLWLKLA